MHLASFVSSIDRYDALLASERSSKVFQTVNILPSPQATSFWGNQRHRLAQAPYFVMRYRSPGEFRRAQGAIWELIQDKKPDLLYADRLQAAQYILDFEGLPRVVDAHDASSLNFRRAAAHAGSRWKKMQWLLDSRSMRRFEVATARAVDAYLVNSRIDQQVLQSYSQDMKVYCIPNGVDTQYFAPNAHLAEEPSLIFTGVMGYEPNRDAAHFLCGHIIPLVKDVVPQIQVQLVGSDPPEDVRALAGNGVVVTGMVPDVRPYVRRATIYVSPLRFGTGVKNKLLAALAMGKAVVATTESCAGLDVTPGEHLLVADDPAGFAQHVVSLLTDPVRRRKLGIAGRQLVVRKYAWDTTAKQLESLLENLTNTAPKRPSTSTESLS